MTSPAESSASEGALPSEIPGEDADPWIGRTLAGRYRFDARLGSGGMGAVYRARHLALDREVAVKILHARLTEDPVVARRFDREALAASRLDHPGIVQMLDAGTAEDGTKFLVMQLLSGQELRSLQHGAVPADRVVEITVQILRALEHAHRRGLVHRDLKPENVIVTRDDDDREVVKLLDFGIVKLLSGEGDDDKLTRAGMVFGTPRYMSPEQAAGGKVDARADLYTVGVIMYEMLAGAPPFQGDEMGIVLRMHILADPPPLPEHVPAPIAAVVMRLLQKRPIDRFDSAKDVQDALLQAAVFDAASVAASPSVSMPVIAAGVTASSPNLAPSHAPTRRPASTRGPIVALLVLAVGVVIGWALLSGPEGRGPTIETERPVMGEGVAPPAVGTELGTTEQAATNAPAPSRPETELDEDDDEPPPASARDREASKKREEKEREALKRAEKRTRKGREHRGRKGKDR